MAEVVRFPAGMETEQEIIGEMREQAAGILAQLLEKAYRSGFADGYEFANMEEKS